MKKMNDLVWSASVRLDNGIRRGKEEIQDLIWDETGDTNFISILVLLGIALALAGVFLSYQEDVLGWVETNIGPFFSRRAGR